MLYVSQTAQITQLTTHLLPLETEIYKTIFKRLYLRLQCVYMKHNRKLTQNTDKKKSHNINVKQRFLAYNDNLKTPPLLYRDDSSWRLCSTFLHLRNIFYQCEEAGFFWKYFCVYSNQIKFPSFFFFIIFYLCVLTFFLLVPSKSSTSGCQKLRLQKWKYPHYANLGSTDRHVLFYKLHPLVRSQNVFE